MAQQESRPKKEKVSSGLKKEIRQLKAESSRLDKAQGPKRKKREKQASNSKKN